LAHVSGQNLFLRTLYAVTLLQDFGFMLLALRFAVFVQKFKLRRSAMVNSLLECLGGQSQSDIAGSA
jgi:hypothetical protein